MSKEHLTKAPKKKPLPERCMVEVDPQAGADFESIRKLLGNPKKITLATAALRYVVKRVKSREMALVNSELQPTA